MNRDAAETIALQAIAHIISDEQLQNVFLNLSGLDEASLRARIQELDVHCAALDFLMQSDEWLLNFAESLDLNPETIARARHILSPLEIYG